MEKSVSAKQLFGKIKSRCKVTKRQGGRVISRPDQDMSESERRSWEELRGSHWFLMVTHGTLLRQGLLRQRPQDKIAVRIGEGGGLTLLVWADVLPSSWLFLLKWPFPLGSS